MNRIIAGLVGVCAAYAANQAMNDAARLIVYAFTGDEKVLEKKEDDKKKN